MVSVTQRTLEVERWIELESVRGISYLNWYVVGVLMGMGDEGEREREIAMGRYSHDATLPYYYLCQQQDVSIFLAAMLQLRLSDSANRQADKPIHRVLSAEVAVLEEGHS